MKKYLESKVIVPWDFSELSTQALQSTLEMVDSPDQIKVVHVTPYPPATSPGVIWGAVDEDSIRKNLTESFREISEQAGFPELEFTAEFGSPGNKIAGIAKNANASLIVISSHGRSGINRLLLGSVAERVVRLAPCPVLVLRGQNEE